VVVAVSLRHGEAVAIAVIAIAAQERCQEQQQDGVSCALPSPVRRRSWHHRSRLMNRETTPEGKGLKKS